MAAMSQSHPINQTLLSVLDNQISRTDAALDGMSDEAFTHEPGADCASIRTIGQHLIKLRRFQLLLLRSPLAAEAVGPDGVDSAAELVSRLGRNAGVVRRAIAEHDPADWLADPDSPREGPWADEPTLLRIVRPLNDFTNHLGAIRAIRRMLGNPADGVQ